MDKIELKDFSVKEVENVKLYKKIQDVGILRFDTSNCEVVGNSNKTEPILEIQKATEENRVLITTYGYIGRFSAFGVEFYIGYRFGEIVLNRMISKVNDFELKTLQLEATKKEKKTQDNNLIMKILYLNFILKLKKLSILGLPKSYVKIEHYDKFRGQIDTNRFIKKNIPFQGKISSSSYEQIYTQEIVDVLYTALTVVEKSMKEFVANKIFQLRNLLHHHANKSFVNENIINKALKNKSLQNSLYSNFKDTLELASYIIRHTFDIGYKNKNFLKGLVFDVSLLWENYLYKLLREHFEKDDWTVLHEDRLEVYRNTFYERSMYPDIVIKNEIRKEILVFDAKSKSMKLRGTKEGVWDVDRSDFFQIHTYMSYYHNRGYKVIAGGLLYPIEKTYNEKECLSDNWLGNNDTRFIIDGIELNDPQEPQNDEDRFRYIIEREENFIKRIKKHNQPDIKLSNK
jgi:5-methylcytosine-specific restriction endonuclease McrBC regulatory subunit McrC